MNVPGARNGKRSIAERAAVIAAFAAVTAGVGGCEVNPATGERQLALISEEQEVAMGREAAGQVAQSIGLVDSSELQEYVEGVGLPLAADSERPNLPWQFRVVDDPTPNAFALPGGYIYITRGLINLLTSEAQLAAVLGHEIGHVTARHSVAQLSRAQLAQLGLGLGTILSPEVAQLGDLLGSGVQLLFLKYGRDDERQADELGFRYMLAQGYEVREVADVFAALQAASKLAGASPLPEWLASHPSEPERIENAEARVEAAQPPADLRVGRDDYLAAVDGTIYGEDPRKGFFRGDWFYHPELIFQFRVPEGWQRQNLPTVVQAVSPERDAAVQLSIVPVDRAEEAANAFFSQENVAVLRSGRDELNGNEAIVSEFRASAQGGIAHGYVAHIEHGNAVYQLVGYAPEQAFAARARDLRQIVTSFSGIRDEDVLDVEPRRLDVVVLPREMSLADFAREYESAVPLEELALINQVDDVDERLPAGTRLKRVV